MNQAMSYHFSDFVTAKPVRSSYRRSTSGTAKYRAGLIWRDLRVLDLSAEGIRISGQRPLLVGQKLHLRLPVLGDIVALVRWRIANTAGCQFASAIDQVLVDAYLLNASRN